jgi:hypothetical protein
LVQKLEDLYSLLVYLYAPSSFGMKNKQYYIDGLKEHLITNYIPLNYKHSKPHNDYKYIPLNYNILFHIPSHFLLQIDVKSWWPSHVQISYKGSSNVTLSQLLSSSTNHWNHKFPNKNLLHTRCIHENKIQSCICLHFFLLWRQNSSINDVLLDK